MKWKVYKPPSLKKYRHQFEFFILINSLIIPQDYNRVSPLAYFEAGLDNIMNATAPKQTPPAEDLGHRPSRGTQCKAQSHWGLGDAQHPLHPLGANTRHALMEPWVSTRERNDPPSRLMMVVSQKTIRQDFPSVIPVSIRLDPRGITPGLGQVEQFSRSGHLVMEVILPLFPGTPLSFPRPLNC